MRFREIKKRWTRCLKAAASLILENKSEKPLADYFPLMPLHAVL
jgi:hypothetical protein